MFNSTSTTAYETAPQDFDIIIGTVVPNLPQKPAPIPAYSYAVAPDVVMLPKRAFPADFETCDLRTAFTPAEIYVAEAKIREMKTVKDVVKQTGPTGVLFGAAKYNNPDAHWGHVLEEIEAAEKWEEEIKEIKEAAYDCPGTPPTKFMNVIEMKLMGAEARKKLATNVIETNIDEVRAAVRRAHLYLREYDYRNIVYGQVKMYSLTKEDKLKRRLATCTSCKQPGHWQVDHTKWTCIHCKKTAAGHYPFDCPQKPKKLRRSNRIRNRNNKKKEEKVEIDTEWKYETGWGDDGNWGPEYPSTSV